MLDVDMKRTVRSVIERDSVQAGAVRDAGTW